MKRALAILLSATMALAMLAGCGSSADSGSAGGSSAPVSNGGTSAGSTAPTTDWPGKKTIQIIVPYAAGGDTDFNARLLAEKLSKKTGATFVVSNVSGNGGATGSLQVKNADPDGSTILFHHTGFVVNYISGASDFLFDDAFEFSAVVGRSAGNIITMNSSYGIKDLQDLIDYSKANPGKLKIAANAGATTQATALMLKAIGCDLQMVDAGSASERIAALLGGHVDIIINAAGTVSDYLKNGQLVALCTDSDVRNDYLYKDFNIGIGKDQGYDIGLPFYYFMAFPKGTDPAIVDKMDSLLKEIITTDTDYADRIMSSYYQVPTFYGSDEGKQLLMDAYDKLKDLNFNS